MLKHTPNLLHGGGSAPGHIAGAASSGRDKEFLASPDWARMLETDLLPWLGRVADLGDDVLEVGPGPGLTTDKLRRLNTRPCRGTPSRTL